MQVRIHTHMYRIDVCHRRNACHNINYNQKTLKKYRLSSGFNQRFPSLEVGLWSVTSCLTLY